MARLELYLLGAFSVTMDGSPVTGFESSKVRALLAYLVVEGRYSHSRESIAGLLWPEFPDSAARASLRNALSNLRKALGDQDEDSPYLLVTRETLQFNLESDHLSDIARFRKLVEGVAPSRLDLGEAVVLYQGRFLEGLSLKDSVAFDDWALIVRERLHLQAMAALQQLSRCYAASGEVDKAVAVARRRVALEPWAEEAHQDLMRWLALSGQRSVALSQYAKCREVLNSELGVEPAVATVQLYEAIRTETLRPTRKPADVDASTPAMIVQAHLPTQFTPFVGRDAELLGVDTYMADQGCRLLTLVGPGGSGKTRLALAAGGRQAARFDDGVWWVSMGTLEATQSAAPAILAALGHPPADRGDPRDQLLGYLRGKRVLLVLDDVERLLSPGTKGALLDLLAEILATSPHLKIIATSRASLGMFGEALFPVSGMRYPESSEGAEALAREGGVEAIAGCSAVQLFTLAAQRSYPGFGLSEDNWRDIVQICRHVQGTPLALVLAAGWVRLLSPGEIAAQIATDLDFLATDLYGIPERQRSLRAVFDHSWTLLDPRERQVFTALAVFRGPFSRSAALAVSGASLRELRSLVDKSLLQPTSEHLYQLHNLVRQYGEEKLEQVSAVAEAVRDRHSAYYTTAVRAWSMDMKGPRQPNVEAEMSAEIDNVHQAWQWAVEHHRVDRLDQAAMGLALFDVSSRHIGETVRLFRMASTALRKSVEVRDTEVEASQHAPLPTGADELRVLARILAFQAYLEWWHRGAMSQARDLGRQSLALLERSELAGRDLRLERAQILYLTSDFFGLTEHDEESLFLFRTLRDPWWTAEVLRDLGWDYWQMGDFHHAEILWGEGMVISRELSAPSLIRPLLMALGSAAWESGEYAKAGLLWQEGLEMHREAGHPDNGITLYLATYAPLLEGHLDEAERLARDCITLSMADSAALIHVWGLRRLGRIRIAQGRYGEADALLTEGRARCVTLGAGYETSSTLLFSAEAKLHLGEIAQAQDLVDECLALTRERNLRRNTALGLLVLGRVALAEGAFDEAAQHLEEGVRMLEAMGPRKELGTARADLCIAALGLRKPDEARQHLLKALRMPLVTGDYVSHLDALAAAALFLVDQGRVSQAVEVYTVASAHPYVANSRWFDVVARAKIAAAGDVLPPDVAADARTRGQARDLGETLKELVERLDVEAATPASL